MHVHRQADSWQLYFQQESNYEETMAALQYKNIKTHGVLHTASKTKLWVWCNIKTNKYQLKSQNWKVPNTRPHKYIHVQNNNFVKLL